MRMTTLTVLLCGCVLPAFAQDVSAVQQASQKFASAMSSGDGAAAAEMFADGAVVLPPGKPALRTKPEIQRFLGAMARGVQNLQFKSDDVKPMGDSAARELGSMSFKTKGRNGQSARDINAKYLLVWERSGTDWKIGAEMWSQNGNGQAQGGGGRKRGGGLAPGGQDTLDQ